MQIKNKKFMVSTTVVCALLIFFSPILMAYDFSSSLHDDLAALLKEQNLRGAVWATVNPENGIRVDATGIKNANTGEKLSSNERIHIGSVTKPLIATGVLHLVSEGKLKLETPVSELLPDVVFDNPWTATDPVRVRHLLDHSAGLDDARLWQIFSLKPDADTPLADTFKSGGSLLRVRTRPGSRFSYSNMSYGLLGMVLESVTGERYERYLDRELLKPLLMNDSTFGFISQKNDRRIAMGHFENGEAHLVVPIYLRPAGQFTSTAKDMALFAKFLMSDGRINGDVFIDQALLMAMGKPVGTEAAKAGLRVGYGLGLFTRDRNGAVGRCHGGDTSGYHAMLCIYPEQKRAFFVSINTGSEIADYNAIDRTLVDALKLTPTAPAPRALTSLINTETWAGFYIPAPNRISTFAYIDTALNFATLRREGTAIRFKPLQSKEVLLTPVGGAFFSAPERLMASHVLLTSAEGKRVISTGSQSFEQASLMNLVLLWASLIFGLLGLVYVLLAGLVRTITRRLSFSHPIAVPFLSILAFVLPLPFFYRQSFLELGDLTIASGLLAVVTAFLPIAMLTGLWRDREQGLKGKVEFVDGIAMLAVLQWTIVLAVWGLLPLRLWA